MGEEEEESRNHFNSVSDATNLYKTGFIGKTFVVPQVSRTSTQDFFSNILLYINLVQLIKHIKKNKKKNKKKSF